jgi:hypothetical protein
VFGRPSNPAFLLAAGELLERTRGRLAVVSYEEGRVDRAAGPAVIQRLAAVGLHYARPWPSRSAGHRRRMVESTDF